MVQVWTEKTASELATLYRQGVTTPSEVLEAVLAQIARVNPSINAFRVVDESGARKAAAAADARFKARAPRDLLDGVPVSIKDLLLTEGLSTLRGSRSVAREQAWSDDAPAVARLREAGAVLLGKTTTPEFGCKGVTDSFLTGISRNPYDLGATPGGSSGGAAAAVAARMGPLAIGTDGAGSIRIPSAFCGVAGLKASFGRVPVWPASPFGTLSHAGPHARSVMDLALALNVLARPDRRDWFALQATHEDYAEGLGAGLEGMKIAYSPTLGYAQVDHDVALAARQAADALSDLGAEVTECDPGFDDPLELICALWFVGAATLVAGIPQHLHAELDPMLLWQAEHGARLSAVQMNQINIRRAELGRHMRAFHQRFDLLLTPAVAVTAMAAIGTATPRERTPSAFLGWTPFSYPFNLTQQPAVVLPAGLARNGLPVSVQLVADNFADATLLRAAAALESRLPATPAPPVAR